jgi:DNA-binding NarL/FixJ family response regulator
VHEAVGDVSVGYALGDSSVFFAEGVVRILGQHGRLHSVARTTDPEQVPTLARRCRPDIVIVGFEPAAVSIELARALYIPVVVLSWAWRNDDLMDAMRAGARGCLRKDVSPLELEHALLHVASGGTVFHPDWERVLIDRAQSSRGAPRPDHKTTLTPRETEIVQLLVDGYSNKRIAMVLGIAHQTVKNHLRNVMAKLAVSSRRQLREWAVDQGYTAPRPDWDAESRDSADVAVADPSVPPRNAARAG